jgi:hypothetical protein
MASQPASMILSQKVESLVLTTFIPLLIGPKNAEIAGAWPLAIRDLTIFYHQSLISQPKNSLPANPQYKHIIA